MNKQQLKARKEYNRIWKLTNIDKVKDCRLRNPYKLTNAQKKRKSAYGKKWQQKNKDKVAAIHKRYAEAHPDRIKARNDATKAYRKGYYKRYYQERKNKLN